MGRKTDYSKLRLDIEVIQALQRLTADEQVRAMGSGAGRVTRSQVVERLLRQQLVAVGYLQPSNGNAVRPALPAIRPELEQALRDLAEASARMLKLMDKGGR